MITGFDFIELELKGAFLIRNFNSGDSRGSFTKCFEKDIFHDAGISFSLNETFYSFSVKNVIRGLHFQKRDPQAKLVSVLAGSVWDVIVDLRPDSTTFKKWTAHELSAENHLSFYIPKGFAHGFVSLKDGSVMLYQCDGKYNKSLDSGIRFDDPEIAVEWPISIDTAVISERDLCLPGFNEYFEAIGSFSLS